MAYEHSDPAREKIGEALPDIEIIKADLFVCRCDNCDESFEAADFGAGEPWAVCPDCAHEVRAPDLLTLIGPRYYYRACFPGCLPDSDPVGPFETYDEALEAARDE